MIRKGVLVKVQSPETRAQSTSKRAQNSLPQIPPKDDLGFGKVIEVSESTATVEYFCSIGQRLQKEVPLELLQRVKLPPQTRCYVKPETQDNWIIGRIFDWDDERNQYRIDLPDKKTASVAEPEIYVRCNLPIDDPIESLAMKAQETPYFHDRRLAFIQSLIQQRAVSRGMTGLISANINLYAHQVEIVRRVLEDPIQRYLLADDTGLGKTIEAGVILRQYLIDEPQRYAVILTPQSLVNQWLEELESKFYLSNFSNRVQVLAIEEIERVNQKVDIGLLILDEAHQIAALGNANEMKQRRKFEEYRKLAHQCDRLLLLSTIPVLNHEKNYLTLLHLLDPNTYKLNEFPAFQAKIANRQEIGKALLALEDQENLTALKSNLSQLKNLLAEDQLLLSQIEELEKSLLAPEPSAVEQNQLIQRIHTHISNTYRLDRRMLRNRRNTLEDVMFERNFNPKVEYDLDERSYSVHECLEQWRTAAPHELSYQTIFQILFRASGTWLEILDQVLTARLNKENSAGLIQEFGETLVKTLIETPLFSGEKEILRSLLDIIKQPSEDGDRIELLKTLLLYHLAERFKLQSYRSNLKKLIEQVQQRLRRPLSGDTLPKVVIFTSFAQTGAEIFRSLSETFGEEFIAKYQLSQAPVEAEKSFNQFKTNPNCFILVCDSLGEEGRNLQFIDWMIHFDLPWSPNRLESRIGRCDRIHRLLNIQCTVFAGSDLEDSFHDAWLQVLRKGWRIFEQSIASLQFYIEHKLAELETILFQSGSAQLLETIPQLQQEILEEHTKIKAQNVLDEIDAQTETATQYFTALDDYDAQHQDIKRGVEDWICQALQFKPITDPNLSAVRRYKPTTRTLIPIHDLKTHFAAHADQSGTYNRRIATQNPGLNLYRIGEGFVEALAIYTQWEDRGQAFAMWRCDEAWNAEDGQKWFGFRFNYIIETDLTMAEKVLTAAGINPKTYQALKRRADGLFSPRIEAIFVDASQEGMSIVEDEILLSILQRPYKGKSPNSSQDYNLAKSRLPMLNEFVQGENWSEFCYQARRTSEGLLRDRNSFIQHCEQQAMVAEQQLENGLEQLRLRLYRFAEDEKTSPLAQELALESRLSQALLEGIRHPQLKLNSVGFMVVSKQPPLQFQEDGDE